MISAALCPEISYDIELRFFPYTCSRFAGDSLKGHSLFALELMWKDVLTNLDVLRGAGDRDGHHRARAIFLKEGRQRLEKDCFEAGRHMRNI